LFVLGKVSFEGMGSVKAALWEKSRYGEVGGSGGGGVHIWTFLGIKDV
jgi:hypothetical protein